MNEFENNFRGESQPKDLFVFSPTGGISLNMKRTTIPQTNNFPKANFELVGTHPLIKANKGNFSEFDHYIEDPTGPQIKNAILNNITCLDGKPYLKKDAIDLIYCSFEAFSDTERYNTITSHIHIGFFLNILIMYSPELRQNSLNQYYATLINVLSNSLVPLDMKFLLTNKALEIEWEKCGFGKYSLFKNFFSVMKSFLKSSPLFQKATFADEATTQSYQDLLNKTLSGRAFAIMKYLVDNQDPLNLLILFKTVEWFQKLEASKLLLNFSVNYFLYSGKGKQSVEFLKQMYGKAPLVLSGLVFETENGVLLQNNVLPEGKPEGKPETTGATAAATVSKPVFMNGEGSAEKQPVAQETSSQAKKPKAPATAVVTNEKPKTPAKQEQAPQTKKKEEVQSKAVNVVVVKEKEIDVEEIEAGPKRVKYEKIQKFFELLETEEFDFDIPGRIANFFNRANKFGYTYSPADGPKFEKILVKFKKNFENDQSDRILQNYKKFCEKYELAENTKIIALLEKKEKEDRTKPSKKEEHAIQQKAIIQEKQIMEKLQAITVQKGKEQKKKQEPVQVIEKQREIVIEHKKVKGKQQQQHVYEGDLEEEEEEKEFPRKHKKDEGLKISVINQESPKKERKNREDREKEKKGYKEKQEEKEKPEVYNVSCKNVSPFGEQLTINKQLIESTTRIHEDLNRILSKKFAFLKVIKIGSIGCGYATTYTDNFNVALVVKDFGIAFNQETILDEVFAFLVENYFKENSEPKVTVQYNRKTIVWTQEKQMKLNCSIVFDNDNQYQETTSKIKYLLSTQPAILQIFYKLQDDLQGKGLLAKDKFSSYILMIMLISSCQLEFQGRKFLPGLKENSFPLSKTKIKENELLKRFTTIFNSCLQNASSRSLYFSLLNGTLGNIAASKSHFQQQQCLVYLEDPFQPDVNCTMSFVPDQSKEIVSFIENLYSTYGSSN